MELRLPEISGSVEEQVRQLQVWLFDLTQQLQFAMEAPERTNEQAMPAVQTPAQTFSSIKSLIIKSADIVESYCDAVQRRLEGQYAAQSAFGSFRQETEQRIRETAESIERNFRNVQEVRSAVAQVQDALLEVNASIRTGLLYTAGDGTPVYGVEIGQQEQRDGVVCFRKFARLMADRLSFYDSQDREVAYISDYRLYVTGADIQQLEVKNVNVRRLEFGDYCWTVGEDGHLRLN